MEERENETAGHNFIHIKNTPEISGVFSFYFNKNYFKARFAFKAYS